MHTVPFAPLRRTLFPSISLLPALLLALLLMTLNPANAGPSTISYTGQLLSSGVPVPNGTYDFQFSLYTAPTGGTQVGSTLIVSNVPVQDGVFSVQLNFGGAVTGQVLYLQTAYRLHPASGNPPYITQSPRPVIPTTEYAIYADTAGSANFANSSSTASVSNSTKELQGKGISTTAPSTGQVLTWNGSLWTPEASTAGTYTAGSGLTLSGSQFSVAVPLTLTGTAENGILVVSNTTTDSGPYDGIQAYASGSTASGVVGIHYGSGNGVYGQTATGDGVYGVSTGNGNAGYFSAKSSEAIGVYTIGGFAGVYSQSLGSGDGTFGGSTSGNGLEGYSQHGNAVYANTYDGYAGYFNGNVYVGGTLSKAGGSFKIDDPLDPGHKYLSHSFVESPDMKNIYDGTIVTDAQGNATVTMPDWFEALNQDFRYQLTCMGQFAQAIVATEITNNTFTIKTDKPNVKVSWQVTGTRHDAWANAHRIPVEEDKPEKEQGTFLHPQEIGMPESMGVNYARRHK